MAAPRAQDPALRETKAALRRRLQEERRARAAADPAAAARAAAVIHDRLCALPAVGAARVVASYAALPGEVDLDPLHGRLAAAGKRVVYPRVAGRGAGLAFHAAASVAELRARGPLGIREPDPSAAPTPVADIDAVLVPGVAFDRAGRRLGQGGGYYDALLAGAAPGAGLRADAARVGVAFASQIQAEVPAGPDDRPVDFVVTEREVVDCGGKESPRGQT
ncbi:MAG TPA: 5-formyltetrahydrofolate cyclo-ligase [Myxococcota bacterium]|jgi:5-formyltetrahydrofolate cyclo-ligase|nr:5-formyltetrahydrofolate cyclo-ligase [Myxococcota bacterium]